MILVLDIGNTQLFGGLFVNNELKLRFRRTSKDRPSSDELGLFLVQALRENGFDTKSIKGVMLASVVPDLNHSVGSACVRYFNQRPMLLQAGIKTGLNLKIKDAKQVGSDLIAGMVAATHKYPNKSLIVTDLGTATTLCVVTKNREYLGGAFAPGVRLAMEALEQNTSSLPAVELKAPDVTVGKDTIENIQSGIYYSTLGLIKEFCSRVKTNEFKNEPEVMLIATGGFSSLFEQENIFDAIEPNLVLEGLYHIWLVNQP